MEKKTLGTVISVKRQWWLKINTKPIRTNSLDGAIFPHIVKVKYSAEGMEYIKRKWLGARLAPPSVGDVITVVYQTDQSNKIRLEM